MATKINKLTAAKIIPMLGMFKNKYSSELAAWMKQLHAFIQTLPPFNASVIETNITIADNGARWDEKDMLRETRERLLHKYKSESSEIKELEKIKEGLYEESHSLRRAIKKTRKKKEKEELSKQADESWEKAYLKEQQIDKDIETIIENKRLSLEQQTFTSAQMREELRLMEAVKIRIVTDAGKFSFVIPVKNKFYNEICNMLRLPLDNFEPEPQKKIKYEIICFDNLPDLIRKSVKFISTDDLRPAMTGVCLDFTKKGVEVVSTDAHRLYQSKRYECEVFTYEHDARQRHDKAFQLIIARESLPKLLKQKVSRDEPCTILVHDDLTCTINGVMCQIIDAKFPDYKVVIPKYTQKARFYRKDFMACVKSAQVYSNKSTNQVNIHFNGDLEFHAQDVDFSFESDIRTRHLQNDFGDFTIGFNGSFIQDCLSIFKTEEIDMYQCGSSTKAAIFTDGTDRTLLMPLMLNQ